MILGIVITFVVTALVAYVIHRFTLAKLIADAKAEGAKLAADTKKYGL